MRLQSGALAALVLAACAPPERPLLEQFFGASRLRDATALQSIATLAFEPRQDGIVRTFEITGVTPERRDGQKATKDVIVTAPVILPSGETVRKTLVVTLERAGPDGSARWLVTSVRDAAASRSAPPL